VNPTEPRLRAPTTARPRGRRPGTESSRAAVLDAARSLFAEVGFERATIRAIAARAGVDPALVHHFFGAKDALLRATLVLPVDPDAVFAVLAENPGDEGRALVARVLKLWSRPQVREQFTALLRAAMSHEEATAALRDLLTHELVRRLAGRVGTDDAPLRAALVASQLAGLAMTRFIIGIEPITTATDAQLIAAVGPTIQRYLTGDIG
jgi:AcrR family transcriptional regulator